jgi:glycosyltransferase involved in cell wall biosynthesis
MNLTVALLAETFAPAMGYLQNLLPKYLARLGADVHVITEDLSPYYQMPEFGEIYGDFPGAAALRAGTVESTDGYTLHVLGHRRICGYMRMRGLHRKLRQIRPDIVQTMCAIGWIPLDAALGQLVLGYRLFTGSHTAASCYPPARRKQPRAGRVCDFVTRYLPGRVVSWRSSKCYAVTSDCGEIASRFFGVQPAKVEVMHLGVDAEVFHPAATAVEQAQRSILRRSMGFAADEIVSIYTGKMSAEKNPLLLAEAVERLRAAGRPHRALFVGAGEQTCRLRSLPCCTVLPFMPFQDLARYYRACDIAVWPTNESISMLDAAASGLPLIVSDGIAYREHVEGNGLVYRIGEAGDLVRCLLALEDSKYRQRLGEHGAIKMKTSWSWETRAQARLADYERALCRPGTAPAQGWAGL